MREAANAYRAEHELDPCALKLLERLVDDPDAAAICQRLNLEESSFLRLCILVEQVARTFLERVEAKPIILAQLERFETAVAELRGFVSWAKKSPPASDLLSVWVAPRNADPDDAFAVATRGLNLIESLIWEHRRIAETSESRFGATRDKHHKEAANNAAIWRLADEVRRATGKAYRREVAELVQIILGVDVSENRVRHAVRTRHRGP
jgi:hypothetical protein